MKCQFTCRLSSISPNDINIARHYSRCRPLRIQYEQQLVYTVIYGDLQHDQAGKPSHLRAKNSSNNQITSNSQKLRFLEHLLPLGQLLESFMELYTNLQDSVQYERDTFRQTAANTLHYHSMIMETITKLDKSGAWIWLDEQSLDQLLVRLHTTLRQEGVSTMTFHSMQREDGGMAGMDEASTWQNARTRRQLLERLGECEQQVSHWDYQNTCMSIAKNLNNSLEYPAPCFFIALPSNLDVWEDLDPSTHHFRFHFICDFTLNEGAMLDNMPQHLHLSDHTGYRLQRKHEFFQKFGGHVLQMLRMVKRGCSSWGVGVSIPNTSTILQGGTTDVMVSPLSEDNFELFVDKAIAYLQNLSPPKWKSRLWPTRKQVATIKTFLDVQVGDNAEGNLHRYISADQKVHWVCQTHIHLLFHQQWPERLSDFVQSHGGHVNTQQATLSIDLRSMTEADQFRTLLRDTKIAFDLSIKLSWKTTRPYVEQLCQDIAKTNAVVLEIDGIPLDIHPPDLFQYTSDLFADRIMRQTSIKRIVLLNYPGPHEQCLYIGNISMRLWHSPSRPLSNWMGLRSDLVKFDKMVSERSSVPGCMAAARELRSALVGHRLSEVTKFTMHNGDWGGVFDLLKGEFVQIQTSDMQCPKTVVSSGSLKQLIQDLHDVESFREVYQLVHGNTGLQELCISTPGQHILDQFEHFAKLRHCSSGPLILTMIERMHDSRGRVLAQLVIGGRQCSRTEVLKIRSINSQSSQALLGQVPEQVVPVNFHCLQWHCDHVFSPLSDYHAAFIDMMTQQHPSVLTHFTLDVSRLSRIGFTSIKKVLRQSNLGHLHVVCLPFDPRLSNAVSGILGSVQWSTLKSLVLSGDNINEWTELWPSMVAARLLFLNFRGKESAQQELSHLSTLFIHQLVYNSPLIELYLMNVQLQDKNDWFLIIGSVNFSLLKILNLCASSFKELISKLETIDLFVWRMRPSLMKVAEAVLVVPQFTLDTFTLSHLGLARAQRLLFHCNLKILHVICSPLDDPNLSDLSLSAPGLLGLMLSDSSLSDSIAQVLDSVQWSTLISLELSGENVDEWLQLMPPEVNAPWLRSLSIRGPKSMLQTLSYPSVLFVRRLLAASPLEELNIYNVLLERRQDWERIVWSMNLVLLDTIDICENCHSQLMSCTDAVDLFNSKLEEIEESS